ncbi:MAG: DinB family protein [Anaerolineae bacterium]
MANTKIGRPRRYDLRPVTGFANADVALAVAALDELLERTLDQFEDLPQEALDFAPQGTPLTIGALVIHMAWAEMGWVERIAPASIPDDLRARLEPGRKVPKGEAVTSTETARDLAALCHRVRDEVTYPALAPITDAEAIIQDPQRPLTPRGVLMHLIWHWTYHSAHIGLLRELWGSDYTWTFGSLGV